MDRIKLPVKAKDNHGYEYDVYITRQSIDSKYRPGAPLVKISGTPGTWYLEDLMSRAGSQTIYLDIGEDWKVVNFNVVMASALSVI